jgi:ADP-heptose:LPS heptosyltransferase
VTPRHRSTAGGRREVVVVASGGLGDCLLLTPFVRHFGMTGHRVVVACPASAQGIFRGNPHIDTLIPCVGHDLLLWALPEPGRRVFSPYLAARPRAGSNDPFDLDAEPLLNLNRGRLSAVRQLARRHRIRLASEKLELFTTAEDDDWAASLTATWRLERPLVVLCPGTREPAKAWPTPLWQRLVVRLAGRAFLAELSARPVLSGCDVAVPLPSVGRSAALVDRAACLVSTDSFPAHLAAARSVPAVVLFGPSNPAVFGHEGHANLRPSSCRHCMDTQRFLRCASRECLLEITPELVAQAVLDKLSSGAPAREGAS